MSALNAPYEPGQKVTVGRKEDCCPVCGSADLVFAGHLDADSGFGFALGEVPGTMGIFCCTGVHDDDAAVELELRYADVTPVDPATGHAQGYPRPYVPAKAETGPQTPPPCPVEWCARGQHKSVWHESRDFRPDSMVGTASVLIVQQKDDPPIVQLWHYQEADGQAIKLWGYEVLALTALIEHVHPGSPLAAALRQAADELDRITSGGGS